MRFHHRRYGSGRLIRFRFSVRVSGPLEGFGYIIEVWSTRHHFSLATKAAS